MPVELGQVWQLGRHRLMCGDATSREDVETLLDGLTADLTLTDPPYGISIVKDNRVGKPGVTAPRQYDPIIGDETTDAA